MTTPQGQVPEALRLADALASNYFDGKQGREVWDAAAAELRNLHAQVAALTQPAQASGVQEDAAREAVRKVLDMFPFNATKQGFSINGGPSLSADGDTEFYSVKKVLEFLTAIKTSLDAARATGAKP